MNLSRDIHSLTDFKRQTPEFLRQLKETGHPLVLMINGKAELVVQDAAYLTHYQTEHRPAPRQVSPTSEKSAAPTAGR
jgi:hypothetical protein